jgi:DNA-directed RNA polymerase subunit RPC12/RpoP
MKRKAIVRSYKCLKENAEFQVRYEQIDDDQWEATWSYKTPPSESTNIDPISTKRKLTGRFILPKNFKGCPYCGGKIFLICPECKRAFCHDIQRKLDTECPWCHTSLKIGSGGGGNIEVEFSGDNKGKPK